METKDWYSERRNKDTTFTNPVEIDVGSYVTVRIPKEYEEKARRILIPIIDQKLAYEEKHPLLAQFSLPESYRNKVRTALDAGGIPCYVWYLRTDVGGGNYD